MRRRARLLSVYGALLAVVSMGCGASGSTPLPAVTVHVVNMLSNVVVTSSHLIPGTAVGTPTSNDLGLLLPWGSQSDVRATVTNGSGGRLVLSIDPSGELDRSVARGTFDPSNEQPRQTSIIWSSAELKEGDWVLVAPDGVSVTSNSPSAAPTGTCGPWLVESE